MENLTSSSNLYFTCDNETYNFTNSSATPSTVTFAVVVPVIKFIVGLITVSLYAIILSCLFSCTTIGYSSRMFLIMIFSYNLVYYSVLTFYAPLVAAGVITEIKNVTVLKIISTIMLTPIYAMHLGQSIIAVDRFIVIRFSLHHNRFFSQSVTKSLIVIVFFYGIIFGVLSFVNCCYVVYNPINQVWSYPNDMQTEYRSKSGLISNFVNAAITGALYISVLCFIRKMKLQVTDLHVRKNALKKELTVLVLFAVPWLCSTLSAILLFSIQQLPSSMLGSWVFALSESTRYAYAFEPFLTIIMVKEIRKTLRKKLFRLSISNVSSIFRTTA